MVKNDATIKLMRMNIKGRTGMNPL